VSTRKKQLVKWPILIKFRTNVSVLFHSDIVSFVQDVFNAFVDEHVLLLQLHNTRGHVNTQQRISTIHHAQKR